MDSRIKNVILILCIALLGITSYGQELTVITAHNIKFGNTGILDKLISDEQINECLGVADSKKYSYLAISIKLKSIESLRYFIERGADIEGVCADKTPLMYAAKYGQLDMVKYLVEKGANLNTSYEGKTAYHYAGRFNYPKIRRYLKEQNLK
ncbi:MAG: ankyrin repeat domain-containing protein [Maribacter sp.]